jgi:hypothetical protein
MRFFRRFEGIDGAVLTLAEIPNCEIHHASEITQLKLRSRALRERHVFIYSGIAREPGSPKTERGEAPKRCKTADMGVWFLEYFHVVTNHDEN